MRLVPGNRATYQGNCNEGNAGDESGGPVIPSVLSANKNYEGTNSASSSGWVSCGSSGNAVLGHSDLP